ncbi:hypothetical protein ACQPWY_06405 [Pseudonocardia xinjiangensis]|uniref:hypothetical protein n=1 Tax=Pseudonocardia xinjiangensis TaxID=75289 RepID=UPI003D904CF2
MTGVASAAAELGRRGFARRAELLAMGVTVADLDTTARGAPGQPAGWWTRGGPPRSRPSWWPR